MKLEKIHSVYFVGVGGIGMSAIARWFNSHNIPVAGYDKTETVLTQTLVSEGIAIHYTDDLNCINVSFKNKENTLVVYTPAIPKDHKELNFFMDNGFTVLKRSQVLGLLTEDSFTVGVAGTHGKTTTSSMLAHLLRASNTDATAFLGGITVNYESNLLIGEQKNAPVVVEADEFDRSFLTLHPNLAIITSMDADHLDIYGNHDELKNSFNAFINKLEKGGKLFYHHGLTPEIPTGVEGFSYGIEEGQIQARNIRTEGRSMWFDYYGDEAITNIQLMVSGYHNIKNMIAAISVALEIGVHPEKIHAAVHSYAGVKRRFEYIVESKEVIYIDDYAHHPEEIRSFLESVKALYPARKLSVVFQPHLYSRTNDFAAGFAESLSLADELFLMDIYPARELPMPGVSSALIFKDAQCKEKYNCTKENLLNLLKSKKFELIVTVGAGDIDTFVNPIKSLITSKK